MKGAIRKVEIYRQESRLFYYRSRYSANVGSYCRFLRQKDFVLLRRFYYV